MRLSQKGLRIVFCIYSNRALVSYINMILARDLLIQKNRNTAYFSLLNSLDKGVVHNLVINNILKFYI